MSLVDEHALVLITGISASGKSTVAQLLAERFARGVHIRGDVFRRMVVAGQTPECDQRGSAYALHIAIMQRYGVDRILSFDRGFDAVPGIERVGQPSSST